MIKIITNPVVSTIENAEKRVLVEISKRLSYEIENAAYAAGANGWDGRISMFKWANKSFPSGFLHIVEKILKKHSLEYKITGKSAPKPLGPAPRNCIVDDFEPDLRYDYQFKAVEKLLTDKMMICQAATGSGKTRIAKLAHKAIGRRTLMLSSRKILLDQIGTQIMALGEPVGDINKPEKFNIATVQSLAPALKISSIADIQQKAFEAAKTKRKKEREALTKRMKDTDFTIKAKAIRKLKQKHADNPLQYEDFAKAAQKKYKEGLQKRKKIIEFLQGIDFVIAEEAHEVRSDQFYTVMQNLPNAHYRLALTATPFMSETEEANMRLMASCGQISIKIPEKYLIDVGIMAKPIFKTHQPEWIGGKIPKKDGWQHAYLNGIVNNTCRNNLIVAEAKMAQRHGLSVLILVKQIEHGKILSRMIQAELPDNKFAFAHGETKEAEREIAKQVIAEKGILIGSDIFGTGVDMPAVNLVILAAGGKGEISFRQNIGRGLREKKAAGPTPEPNVCFIVDFLDSCNAYLYKHSLARQRIIKTTDGFDNFVDKFDYQQYPAFQIV